VGEYDLWDKILDNEINGAIETTTKYYKEIKYKQALKHGFFEIQNIKEDYLIAKKQKANPKVLLKFIETQLILINPIVPHFAEYCWRTHVYPVLLKCKNHEKKLNEQLFSMGWPQVSQDFDNVYERIYKYIKEQKGQVNIALNKAKLGGKKAKGGKGAAPEQKVITKAIIFVAHEYPESVVATIEVLKQFEFDENNKIVGDYITKIKEKFTEKNQQSAAMKKVTFLLEEAAKFGKDEALELKTPFDEINILAENKDFIFENLHSITDIKIVRSDDSSIDVEGIQNSKDAASPGKPAIFFY
jgi:leucyl-tRNA synthetase